MISEILAAGLQPVAARGTGFQFLEHLKYLLEITYSISIDYHG